MEIWIKQGNKKLRLPILPAEYEITSTYNNTSVNVNAVGEVTLTGKSNLRTITIASFLPFSNYVIGQHDNFQKPKEYVDFIKNLKNNGTIRLIMTGSDINMLCTIENFIYGENDGTKDINYTIEFKEYRKLLIIMPPKEEIPDTTSVVPPNTERDDTKEIESTVYIVKKNDTLWGIAKKLTGSGTNYIAIANQNEIKNPNLIYVGQRLVINI